MRDEGVIVIGAGPAGLSAAAELRRTGVPATVLERSDSIAASWRRRYDRLRLNSTRSVSRLPGSRFPRGTPTFLPRDEVISYLEDYAARHEVDVRLQTQVERIDRENGGWIVRTSGEDFRAPHVIVATGYDHTPMIPDWPGRDSFEGSLLHAADYRNPDPFRGQEVLVIGPGCSGVEIAYDLATGGAARVRLAVRTPPNIVLRAPANIPGDYLPIAMMKLPPRIADAQMKLIRRLTVGDLAEHGLPAPEEGIFARLRREAKTPAIVDKEMIEAIREGRIEVVPGVASFEGAIVRLADGEAIEPDAAIAATGYRRGLEPLVGHLDVLDEDGLPLVIGGDECAPGLRFIGYVARPGQFGYAGREARRAAKRIARQVRTSPHPSEPVAAPG